MVLLPRVVRWRNAMDSSWNQSQEWQHLQLKSNIAVDLFLLPS